MKEYSVQQVAELLGKTGTTIRRWVDKGYFGDDYRRDGFGPTAAIMIGENALKEVATKLKIELELD